MTIDPYALGHIRVGLFAYGGVTTLTLAFLGVFLIQCRRDFGRDHVDGAVISGVLFFILATLAGFGVYWLLGLTIPGGSS